MNPQDAEQIVQGKSNDELLALLAAPQNSSPALLEAAKAQLHARGVNFASPVLPPTLPVEPLTISPDNVHHLAHFPVAALIILHFLTCGLFSLIWLNLMHGKLPRARANDPSAGRAIGFCFIPFFNLYWIFFTFRHLCVRIDEQRELYELPRSNLKGLATAACIVQVIPYLNLLIGYTILWPIYLGLMQHSVNQLVEQTIKTSPRPTRAALPVVSGLPGWAVGLIIGASVFVILFVLLLPALAAAKQKAREINCMNNERELALAVRFYTEANQHFPPAAQWCDAIKAEVPSDKYFKCPAADQSLPCDYAFNVKLDGLDESKVDPQTVMIFESDGGWNANGDSDTLIPKLRHRELVVSFADGSVKLVKPDQINSLRWDP